MISWFEKNNKISFAITLLIALFIFYVSSLTFAQSTGGPPGIGYRALIYHITAFFFLAFFLAISLVKGKNRSLIFLAVIISVLYAVLDEIHQSFVPGRGSSISDIFIDSLGIILASIFYIILIEYRKNFKKRFHPSL